MRRSQDFTSRRSKCDPKTYFTTHYIIVVVVGFFFVRVSIIWNVTQHEWFIKMRFLFAVSWIHSWIGFWWQSQPSSQRNCITHFFFLPKPMWTKRNETKTAREKKTNRCHRSMNVVYVEYVYIVDVILRWTMVKNWFFFLHLR